MQYKKGGLILQQYHCEKLKSRNANRYLLYICFKNLAYEYP